MNVLEGTAGPLSFPPTKTTSKGSHYIPMQRDAHTYRQYQQRVQLQVRAVDGRVEEVRLMGEGWVSIDTTVGTRLLSLHPTPLRTPLNLILQPKRSDNHLPPF